MHSTCVGSASCVGGWGRVRIRGFKHFKMGQEQSVAKKSTTAGADVSAATTAEATSAGAAKPEVESRAGGNGSKRTHPNRRVAGGQPMEPVFVYPSTFQGNITANMKPNAPPPYDVSKDKLFGGSAQPLVGGAAVSQQQAIVAGSTEEQKKANNQPKKPHCMACSLFARAGGATHPLRRNQAQKATTAPTAPTAPVTNNSSAVEWARQYLAASNAKAAAGANGAWQEAQNAGGMGLNADQKNRLQREVQSQQQEQSLKMYRQSQMKQLQMAQQQQQALQAQLAQVNASAEMAMQPIRAGAQDQFLYGGYGNYADYGQQQQPQQALTGGASRSKSYQHSRLRRSSRSRSRSNSRSRSTSRSRSAKAKYVYSKASLAKGRKVSRSSRSKSSSLTKFLRSVRSTRYSVPRKSRTTRSSRGSKKRMGGTALTVPKEAGYGSSSRSRSHSRSRSKGRKHHQHHVYRRRSRASLLGGATKAPRVTKKILASRLPKNL